MSSSRSLVFMVEERSMREFLEGFLPRILNPDVHFQIIVHEGKRDLEKSLPRKLKAWRVPNARFVVLRDQDSGNYMEVKGRLQQLCEEGGRPDAVVRVVCRELESWFFGDLVTSASALEAPRLAREDNRAKYRNPDSLGAPSKGLRNLVPGYGKIRGARAVGQVLDHKANRSASFRVFADAVIRLGASE